MSEGTLKTASASTIHPSLHKTKKLSPNVYDHTQRSIEVSSVPPQSFLPPVKIDYHSNVKGVNGPVKNNETMKERRFLI